MQSEAPLTWILYPAPSGERQVERTRLGSLFGDLNTVPPKDSRLPLEKGEGKGEGSPPRMDTAKICAGARPSGRFTVRNFVGHGCSATSTGLCHAEAT